MYQETIQNQGLKEVFTGKVDELIQIFRLEGEMVSIGMGEKLRILRSG